MGLDAFTPNKVQGIFYILRGEWGNRIILVSPRPLFNKRICISGMLKPARACSQDSRMAAIFFRKTICPSNCFIHVFQKLHHVHSCVHLFVRSIPLEAMFCGMPPPYPLSSCPSSSSSLVFLLGFIRNNNGP